MDKPWKVILAFLGVFVAGAVFGGFFSLGIGRKVWEIEAPTAAAKPVAALPAAPAKAKGGGQASAGPLDVQRAQLMRHVTNQLNLTPEQKALIAPIVQRATQDIWRQTQGLYREAAFITQRMKDDIAKELTPDQQKRLDELWQKQLDLFRKKQEEARMQTRGEFAQRRAEKAATGEKSPGADATKASPEPDGAKPTTPEVKPADAKPSGEEK